jgi:hypothetical protein
VAFFASSSASYFETQVVTSNVLCVNGNSFSSIRNDSLTLFITGKRKFMVTIKDKKGGNMLGVSVDFAIADC